jgi:chromosome segregation ATPase
MTDMTKEAIEALHKDVISALKRMGSSDVERRTHWDRRQEFQDWSEGVYTNLKAAQADIKEVKGDIKDLTARVGGIDKALELLKKDHEHSAERWEELKEILYNIKDHGCDVYSQHRAEFEANARADERRIVAQESEEAAVALSTEPHSSASPIGRSVWDIVSGWSPTNIALTAVIALLVLLLMYHEKILAVIQAL